MARRYGVTGPTVRQWRERESTADRSHRPQTLHCTLSGWPRATPAQEAVAMEIRRTLWLPLDDLWVVVREFLNPEVSRSGLARCMKRHGVNQRPVEDKDAPLASKTFKDYAPGFLHVDIKYLPQTGWPRSMTNETTRRYAPRAGFALCLSRLTARRVGLHAHLCQPERGQQHRLPTASEGRRPDDDSDTAD